MDISLGKNKMRLHWLDFGKAMGILVVLIVHAGCRLGRVTFYGGMFYMPIFFVAAGYTYKCRMEEPFAVFLKKKAKRLLIPYFGSSAFLWLFFWTKDSLLLGNSIDLKLHSIMGIMYSRNQMYVDISVGENSVLLDILNAPLWFLTAMFLVYLWYDLISRSKNKYLFLSVGLLLAVIWHYSSTLLLPWSLEAVPYFACFFAAGEWIRENGAEKIMKDIRILGVLLILFLALSEIVGSVNLSTGSYGRSMLCYLIVGCTGSVLIFALGSWLELVCPKVIKSLSLVGQETLIILCFHMFLFMFLRTGAAMLGLGIGLTNAVLVLGSTVLLTGAGRIWHSFSKKYHKS